MTSKGTLFFIREDPLRTFKQGGDRNLAINFHHKSLPVKRMDLNRIIVHNNKNYHKPVKQYR